MTPQKGNRYSSKKPQTTNRGDQYMRQHRFLIGVILLIFIIVLTSCASNHTIQIVRVMNPTELRKNYNTIPPNLASLSKCAVGPSVKVVNAETKNEEMLIYTYWPFYEYISPKILMDGHVEYVNDAFLHCGIIPDQKSTKIIHLALVSTRKYYTLFNFSADTAIEISIPEIKYKTYISHTDTSPGLFNAIPFTLHVITWKIINDPVVQDYLLCR